jgi:NitT/TauT family transport system ATP-binding protein
MEPISPELLSLRGISYSYRQAGAGDEVLRDISLSLNQGASLSLLGPSGCGKTTLLMIIAGLLRPTTGYSEFAGRQLSGPDPGIALVLQQFGLFPWKTVGQNIELGLRLRGQAVDNARLNALLAELGISGRGRDYPGQLSGGQQQRVALARALILAPQLLLLDEPFGALDSLTRERLQDLLRTLWQRSGFAMITVTHSMTEALMLGERILVMQGTGGRISQVIDNPGMRGAEYRDSAEYLSVLEQLRGALGADA